MSIALYRKYRPSDFSNIVGQKHITDVLKNQIKLGKISHAYVFSGVRGTGKTSTAKVFAKAISCENYDDEKGPCGICKTCQNSAIDTIEIDAASNNSVDNIRALQDTLIYLPSFAKYKVYIIDEAHMLSQGAFNALLKTLEEPPAHVIFILATTEIGKIPDTILSRCQKFEFRKIGEDDIFDRLSCILDSEKIPYDTDAVRYIADISGGGLRDAISLADQVSSIGEINVQNIAFAIGQLPVNTIDLIIKNLLSKDTLACLEIIKRQKKDADVKTIPNLIISRLIDLLHIKSGSSNEVLFRQSLSELTDSVDIDTVSSLVTKLSELSSDMKYSQNPDILLDAFVVSVCKSIKKSDSPLEEELQKLKSQVQNLKDEIARLRKNGLTANFDYTPQGHSDNQMQVHNPDKPKHDDMQHTTNIDKQSSPNVSVSTQITSDNKIIPVEKIKDIEISDDEKQLISKINDAMPDIHSKLKFDKNANISALLIEGSVSRVINGTIYLSYDEKMSFHKNKISEDKNLSVLTNAVNTVLEDSYKLKVIFDHEPLDQVPEKKDEILERLRENFADVPIEVV